MKLLQLPTAELRRKLAGSGVWLRTGPFSVKVQSRIPAIAHGLAKLYGQFEVRDPIETFADFHVSVNPPSGLRQWLRPQVEFSLNGSRPCKPLRRDQAFPMLEQGLNWCVSTQAHQYLILQAAVVEKNGLAAILPGVPGAGKSTLTAGLVLSGWRLLSDELTLIDRKSGRIHSLPRPVNLKNQSIDVIRQLSPGTFISKHVALGGSNGTVAHMCPPRESVRRQHESAKPGWMIFPRWEAGANMTLTPRTKDQAFLSLTHRAFNYKPHGADDVRVGSGLIEQSTCYDFQYSQLQEAIEAFDHLANTKQPD